MTIEELLANLKLHRQLLAVACRFRDEDGISRELDGISDAIVGLLNALPDLYDIDALDLEPHSLKWKAKHAIAPPVSVEDLCYDDWAVIR